MCQAARTIEDFQFRRKCQITAGLSLVVYLLCSQTSLRTGDAHLGLVLSGLSGAAFSTELISVGLLIMRLRDEFQRALLVRSFLWATVVTMVVTMIWGSMEMHAHGQMPHLDLIWIPLALVAEQLKVSRQSVNAIETGKYDPSLPLAFKLAKLFGLPLEQIFSDQL